MERLVQLLKGDEPKNTLPEGEDISTLEVDEKDLEVNKPTYFAPVTGVLAAAAASAQVKEVQENEAAVGQRREEVDEDDIIKEV